MNATVIDTLRYANSLKAAGVEPRQAEAMSRAINDELTEGVATKRDRRPMGTHSRNATTYRRNNPHIFRDTQARIVETDPLPYRQLVEVAA